MCSYHVQLMQIRGVRGRLYQFVNSAVEARYKYFKQVFLTLQPAGTL